MAKHKEYKSVSEFPLHTEKLSREELEAHYQNIRNTYRSLTISRGQLFRRQNEAKANLITLQQKLKQTTTTLEKVNAETEKLQKSLAHSVEAQQQLKFWGDSLNEEVKDLKHQLNVTTQLIEDFESVYEEVSNDKGQFSVGHRLLVLIKAAHKLLNTDIKDVMPKKLPPQQSESWKEETPRAIGRDLLDNK